MNDQTKTDTTPPVRLVLMLDSGVAGQLVLAVLHVAACAVMVPRLAALPGTAGGARRG